MTLTLNRPEVQKLIEERVSSGRYASPEDVVAAALATLDIQERSGDFAPGELNKLLAVGIAQADRGELLDAEDVFREIDAIRDKAMNQQK